MENEKKQTRVEMEKELAELLEQLGESEKEELKAFLIALQENEGISKLDCGLRRKALKTFQ